MATGVKLDRKKQLLILMMNIANTNTDDGVNKRASPANSAAPARLSVENQAEAGCDHAIGDKQNVHQK